MYRLNLGFNQKKFNNSPISTAAINIGTMRGKGSTSRIFNYCTQYSKNPSLCINQFVNNQPTTTSPQPTTACDYTFTGTGTLDQATVYANIGTAQNICIQGYTSIGINTFLGKSQITSVTIGTSVTSINSGAFAGCTSLTSITIPNSVTTINDEAFLACANLSNVILGNSVTTIGISSFESCPSLTSITIPNSVTSIGAQAFFATSLLNVTISSTTATALGVSSPVQPPNSKIAFFGSAVYTQLP